MKQPEKFKVVCRECDALCEIDFLLVPECYSLGICCDRCGNCEDLASS